MKYLITILSVLFIVTSAFAQDDDTNRNQYRSAMTKTLVEMKDAKTPEALQALSNKLERITDTEPNRWEATYYLAFVKTIQAFSAKDKATATEELEKLNLALESKLELPSVQKNTTVQSEIHALIAMMYSARMMANPMELGPKFGPLNRKHLGMAEELNQDNPRVFLLYAQNLFYTPEAFGGNKQKAKDMAQKAIKLFEKDSNQENKLMPSWGMDQAESLLKQMTKASSK